MYLVRERLPPIFRLLSPLIKIIIIIIIIIIINNNE